MQLHCLSAGRQETSAVEWLRTANSWMYWHERGPAIRQSNLTQDYTRLLLKSVVRSDVYIQALISRTGSGGSIEDDRRSFQTIFPRLPRFHLDSINSRMLARFLVASLALKQLNPITSTGIFLSQAITTRFHTMSPTASTSSSVHTAADGLPVQLISRVVAKKVKSIETAEGEGALVRRSIGTPALRDISPFLMLDHFDMAQGSFPAHPHRGMTTVTMMLNGYVQHEDFMGNAGIIGPGSVQVMTAGKGIMHAEFPLYHDPKTGEELSKPNGLQLWIDLPAASKFTDPIYQDINATEMATAEPRAGYDVEREGQGWEVRIIAGKSRESNSLVEIGLDRIG